MKTAVLTDSTAYIPQEIREQKNIHMIPLNVLIGDKSYKEEVEITAEEFYQKVRESEEFPKTSQPAIGDVAAKLEELSKDYDAVVAIHLSSGISGTFQGTITASSMVDEIKVYPFDSEISCMLQGFYVLEAAEMAAAGAHPEDIIKRLEEMKKSSRAYFVVDDLTHLHRGGRLSGAQAIMGSLLQVKPVLHFVDKVIVPFEKIRTRKKALRRVIGLFEDIAQSGEPIRATVIHSNCEEDALELIAELESRFPNAEFVLSYFGPVIGTHLGEGALALGWYKK
ncbi:DegV family protein [Bacillaceae bacterium S4-13-58]